MLFTNHKRITENLESLRQLRLKLQLVESSEDMSEIFGKLKADLEKKGQSIDDAAKSRG